MNEDSLTVARVFLPERNLCERSNWNVLPTSSHRRLTLRIQSGISNGNEPTFSSLNTLITQRRVTLLMYLSGFCSPPSTQSVYSK